jgi:hypothetical protein
VKLPVGYEPGPLDEAVRESGLAMIDMRDDAEIADSLSFQRTGSIANGGAFFNPIARLDKPFSGTYPGGGD